MILCIFEILLLIAEKIFKNFNQDAPGNSDKTTAYMQIHVGNMSASVAEWLVAWTLEEPGSNPG